MSVVTISETRKGKCHGIHSSNEPCPYCNYGHVASDKWKQQSGYQEIEGKECSITLESRPHYCDRGNFLAKLFPKGGLVMEIDEQDGWPRYYFDEERAKDEVVAWLKKRNQYVAVTKPCKVSAGLLMYKIVMKPRGFVTVPELQVFLVHPGGPQWENKDDGIWSVPKGEASQLDACLLATAIREFIEETGFLPDRPYISLDTIVQKSGKVVQAWAFKDTDNCIPAQMKCNMIEIEYPHGSGNTIKIPEVDRGDFFPLEVAKTKILPAQIPLLERLHTALSEKT